MQWIWFSYKGDNVLELDSSRYERFYNGFEWGPKPEWSCLFRNKGIHVRKGMTAIPVYVDWDGRDNVDIIQVGLGIPIFRKKWICQIDAVLDISRFFGEVRHSNDLLEEWVTFLTPYDATLQGNVSRFDAVCEFCNQKSVFPSEVSCLAVENKDVDIISTYAGLFIKMEVWEALGINKPRGSFKPVYLTQCT